MTGAEYWPHIDLGLGTRLQRRWMELSQESLMAASEPNPSRVNDSLQVESASEPQCPLTPAYLLWMAENLARERRDREALAGLDRAISASLETEPLLEGLDLGAAALQRKAEVLARVGDVTAALRSYQELSRLRRGDPWPLYEAGRLAEGSGRVEQAARLYRQASSKEWSRAAGDPAELSRRALLRLQSTDDIFVAAPERLSELLERALNVGGAGLRFLSSSTHFAVGPVGGHVAFEDAEILDRLCAEVSLGRPQLEPELLGSGSTRYVVTRGWNGRMFRGDVFFILTESSRGWQWTGIGLGSPTDEWLERWKPAGTPTNQPLPIPLLAPWPAGQSFLAGGLVGFIEGSAAIAAAAAIGRSAFGPLGALIAGEAVAFALSSNPCGFGTRGFYYNEGPTHDNEDAFAIDFTRYQRGVPFRNRSGGTPVLTPAPGIVVGIRSNIRSGDSSSENHVEVMHADPATGNPRFLSRYLHLAGPDLVNVSAGMAVNTGNRLGLMDDTGTSVVHHLHFSIHDQSLPFPGAGAGASGIVRGASVRPTRMDGVQLGDGDSGRCVPSSNQERRIRVPIDLLDTRSSDRERFISQHYVHTETADELHLWTLTGVVILHLRGEGREWRREQVNLGISVPEVPEGMALRLKHWAPLVTLNAIGNDGVSNWAGSAVDWFRVRNPRELQFSQIIVETQVAVRDSDGWVFRLGYEVTLAGTFEEAEGPI